MNGDLRFFCFASVGFDASVVHAVPSLAKKSWGRLTYAFCGLKASFGLSKLPQFEAEITSIGQEAPPEMPVIPLC